MNQNQTKLLEIFTQVNNEIESIILNPFNNQRDEHIDNLKKTIENRLSSCDLTFDDVVNYPLQDLVNSVENKISREYTKYSNDSQDETDSDPFKGIIYLEKKDFDYYFLKYSDLLQQMSNINLKYDHSLTCGLF